MSRRRAGDEDAVFSVTTAKPGHSEDLNSRIVRYAWMMSIRVVCFVLAVLTVSPWRWMFVVAAVLLPYIAVVMANARRSAQAGEVVPIAPVARPELDTKNDSPQDWIPT